MMSILLDSIIAFFSCIGIWTLWNMLIGDCIVRKSRAAALLPKEDLITWMKPEITIK